MRYGIIFVLVMLLCGAALAEFRLAKDRTPGGLYVVGPDISPDSLEGQFLYYSPDAGTTLVIKDSSDYYSAISADYSLGNVYKVTFERLYHSNDYGETWLLRITEAFPLLLTGYEAGELYGFTFDGLVRSDDFGVTTYVITPSAGEFNKGCLGWHSGEIFLLNNIYGQLYYSNDTLSTRYEVYNFGYHGCDLITSGRTGEIYGLSTDSIYYSADYGSTFVGTNTFSLEPEESSLMEIVGGGFSGELYGVFVDYYVDEHYEQHGGSIRICYSRDYGATFTCLAQTADGITYDTLSAIEESPPATPEDFAISAYPNPFNSAVTISLDVPVDLTVEIFDINGRMVYDNFVGDGSPVPSSNGRGDLAPTTREFIWQPDVSIGSGVYLVRARFNSAQRPIDGQTTTKRVVYLK